MIFSCDRTILYETFGIVSRSIPAKNALSVLSCFLIQADVNNTVTVAGFDMDLGITTTVECDVEVPGKLAVDAKMLLDIMRSMEQGSVKFTENDNKTVTVSGGSSEYILPYMDADTYPARPTAEGCDYITIDQKTLHSVIRQTIFAASQSDVKSIYTGAFFTIHDGLLQVVCTDSFRFAIRTEQYESDKPISFIVQGRVLNELIRIMKNDEGSVRVGISGRHIVFEFDNSRMISRLVDGTYMNYTQIFPKSFKYTATVKTAELKKVVEKASVLISEKVKAPIRISLEGEKMFITCRTSDGHSFDDEIDADINESPFEIGVNNRNLLNVLSACECDEIVINFNSPLSSICFLPKTGDSFMFLLAPMRLNGK